jgi:hypothetical protein
MVTNENQIKQSKSMQRTQHAFISLTKIAACAILALGAADQVRAADKGPNGTWTWTVPGRNGGADRKNTLTLKVDGDKLTGKLSSPGRQGAATDTEISDGKLKGDEVSFTVTREGQNGNKFTTKYNGKISGDTIKGKVELPARGGGEATTRDWEAKREAKQ